jgi:hypothetical protein
MSDTTSLSSNYSLTAAFAKEFNGAVLVLKRWHLADKEVPRPAVEEEAEARKKLVERLRGVIVELDPDAVGAVPPMERIPEGVISRLAEKNQDKMSWFLTDLRQVEQSLTGTTDLSPDEFAALDEVCDAADATASASFRRLWRR